MAGFDQELIDRILSATDIVELVGAVVVLSKRTGDNLFGLCPFHKEKSPSFSVNRRKQIYHCFGCSAGGNAIGWLMQYEKIAFPEAVRRLAERAKIELPRYRPSGEDTLNEALYRLHDLAQNVFRERLMSEDANARNAYNYLRQRGLSDETIDACGLGLAPSEWDRFTNIALREGYKLDQLLSSGLGGRTEQGKLYDRFRDRITFPIQNLSGRIVAYGARLLPGKEEGAKYLNSPETPIYHKGELLYGLPWARDTIRDVDSVIVVEGYLDLISLHQAGIQNVVATSGTALTNRQARQLLRFTQHVNLVYDGDDAGRRASLRGGDVLVAEGLDVRIAFLPQGEDPDTFVQKFGSEAFKKLLENSLGWLDHQLAHFAERGLLSTPSGSANALRELLRVLREMQDKVQQEFWIKILSQKLNLTESIVRHELARVATPRRSTEEEQSQKQNQPMSEAEQWEERILSFMIRNRDIDRHYAFHRDLHKYLRPSYFTSPLLRALFDSFLQTWIDSGEFPATGELRDTAKNFENGIQWLDETLIKQIFPPVKRVDPFEFDCNETDLALRSLLRTRLHTELSIVNRDLVIAKDTEMITSKTGEKQRLMNFIKQLNRPLNLGSSNDS